MTRAELILLKQQVIKANVRYKGGIPGPVTKALRTAARKTDGAASDAYDNAVDQRQSAAGAARLHERRLEWLTSFGRLPGRYTIIFPEERT